MKLMIFTYDFPHFKTQEILYRLITENVKIEYVIAAPKKKLPYKEPLIRVEVRHYGVQSTKDICRKFKIPYIVLDHDSPKCEQYIKKHTVDIGLVCGARILKPFIISQFKRGVLNIHPGILPHIRGLDTLKWSIYLNKPLGNTAHLIDPKIDAGLYIFHEKLDIFLDDTFQDISLRMVETQSPLVIKALDILRKTANSKLKSLNTISGEYHTMMTPQIEKQIPTLFEKWKKKYGHKK